MNLILPLIFASLIGFSPQEATRQIYPADFVKARPTKKGPAATSKPAYVSSATKKATPPAKPAGDVEQLGLTIWRLRSSKNTDSGARIIIQQQEQTIELTPERVPSGASFNESDKIRFTFESPRNGYLYVIDRETYADGTLGDPYLIFPTTRTREGDNQVKAGKLVEIPAQEDRPNYFTLAFSRKDQTGELLTVIVTPNPIDDISIGEKAIKLAPGQVEKWEKIWGSKTEKFDLLGGAGRQWTPAEQAAGADGTRQLSQDDPGPQTIYRVAVKPGDPILVKVGLNYRKVVKKR
ncbi:MAG: DUF4384 domain-containing protein [Acidobacteria bacterium]|nr:DUF4384 domain-containing protein [Acidobacteriota bacterium]